jgi:TRAP-type uncharacterized transport system substrate-binding protein
MFKLRLVSTIAASALLAMPALAQTKLTVDTGAPGDAPHLTTSHLAAVASSNGIANLQVNAGQTLSNSVQKVASGNTDITVAPMILVLLMKKGLAMYGGLGKEKGAELAGNLRLLFPYFLGSYHLVAYQSSGINSFQDLKGKKVHNGPPRGGALNDARNIIKLVTGMSDGKDYTGRQVPWPQAPSVMLDGSVDASLRPGSFPANWMTVIGSAGKMNLISVPKAVFESKKFQGFSRSPGHAPLVLDQAETGYGENVKLISEDGKYRSISITGGDVVHKRMSNDLAGKLVTAFMGSLNDFYKKAPFAKAMGHAGINSNVSMCGPIGLKYHPGAVTALEKAGYKIPACAK